MAKKTAYTKKQVEAAAAAIGVTLGPPNGNVWSEGFRDKVKWPDDYSEQERSALRFAAAAALYSAMNA